MNATASRKKLSSSFRVSSSKVSSVMRNSFRAGPLPPPQRARKDSQQRELLLLPAGRHEDRVFAGEGAHDLGQVGAVDGEGYDSGGPGAGHDDQEVGAGDPDPLHEAGDVREGAVLDRLP